MISISAATCYLSGTSLHLVRGGLQPKLFIVQSLEEASVRLICSVFTLFFEVKLFSGNWGRKWGRQAGRQEERRQGGPEEGKICAFRRVCVCVLSCVWPFETPLDFTPWPPRPRDSPGKNTGGGCHALLQGIFPTRGSKPSLSCIGRRVLTTESGPFQLFLTNSFGKLLMDQVIGRKEGQEGERRERGRDQNRLLKSGRKHAAGWAQAVGTRPLPFSHYRERPAKMRNHHRRAGY